MAAARNTQGLLHDAETLAGSGRAARAYSVAAMAVEECGKAGCLIALSVLPRSVRMQAPVGRMLEWHQLKQVGGLLIAALTFEEPGLASRLAAMPAAHVIQILSVLSAESEESDRLKRRGLYVDMDRTGRIREPSEITDAEVIAELARARQATSSAAWLLTPQARTRLAEPSAEAIELACALSSALTRAGHARTPEAAAEVVRRTVCKLRDDCRGHGLRWVPCLKPCRSAMRTWSTGCSGRMGSLRPGAAAASAAAPCGSRTRSSRCSYAGGSW